jgi:phosphate transport system substrate-binding protein
MRFSGLLPVLVWAAFSATGVAAEAPPAYAPSSRVIGTVRIWGHGSFKHDFMGALLRAWSDGLKRYQPDIRLDNQMYGSASAIGALTTGAADLAIMGEEISPAAAAAFVRAKHYSPTGIEIATGSRDVNYFDYAHMIFVHRDNPLNELTVAQLEAIFGAEHRRSGGNIRTWGQLGLTGEWAAHAIQPYGWKVDEDFALYFSAAVLGGSHRWNPTLKEYVTHNHADGTIDDRGQQILNALAADRYGIAISNVRFAVPAVKTLRLAAADGGPALDATPETLMAQTYPLTRIISAFVDRPPHTPISPATREFLRYILSREGQVAVASASGYLPLGPEILRAQLAVLNEGPTVIRVAGSAQMAGVARRWAAGYAAVDPSVQVELNLQGSDVAMAALTAGQADVALVGRECTAQELQAYEWIYRYPPARTELMAGGWTGDGYAPALAVAVHRDNPIARITVDQLARIFGANLPAGTAALRTWGDLGATGRWATAPIHLYAPDMTSGTGRYFRQVVLHDSGTLNWDNLTESTDAPTVAAHFAADRFGLAITSLDLIPHDAKPLPLAATAAGPFELPTKTTVARRTYPLSRVVLARSGGARPPGALAAPKSTAEFQPATGEPAAVTAFLHYLQSPAAQSAIVDDGHYLPLSSP